jgi:hypothetical protein
MPRKHASPAPPVERVPFAQVEREKQASREADARAVADGSKSREQLAAENRVLNGRRWRVDFRSAKRLW